MDFFEEATLRLKQQLKVTEDKQVAEFFGMTGKAWTARKRRDSFPIKELWALAAQRPELGLDPDLIITGHGIHMSTAGKDEAYLLQCYRLMTPQNRSALLKTAYALSDVANLTGEEIAQRLATYSPEARGNS